MEARLELINEGQKVRDKYENKKSNNFIKIYPP